MNKTTILRDTATNNTQKEDEGNWYCEERIREHNPNLDEIQGHRAFVPPGNYSGDSWDALVDLMVTGRKKKITTSARKRKRHSLSEKKTTAVKHVPFHRRRGMSRAQPERMMLCTTDFRPSFVASAVYAGLFPFGSELECFPGKALESRCLLNLELGGKNRCASKSDSNDHGGRVVLSAPFVRLDGSEKEEDINKFHHMSLLPLHIGKKTLRALRNESDSFTIRVGSDRKFLVNRLVEMHGIDWIGFEKVRTLLESPLSEWNGLPAHLITIELWYTHENTTTDTNCSQTNQNKGEQKKLISGEIGFLCGSCYMCLSLFNDTSLHPRCDRIRAEGAALLLSEIGVRLIDVGTSANYFGQFGFKKTTRREFVSLWRHWRSIPLMRGVGEESELSLSGKELVEKMEAHRHDVRLPSST